MLEKLVRRRIHRFKEYKNPSWESKIMAPQSWQCPGHVLRHGDVGDKVWNESFEPNRACHISFER